MFIFTDQWCPQHAVQLSMSYLNGNMQLSAEGVFYKVLNDLHKNITMANALWVKWPRKRKKIIKITFSDHANNSGHRQKNISLSNSFSFVKKAPILIKTWYRSRKEEKTWEFLFIFRYNSDIFVLRQYTCLSLSKIAFFTE